VLAGAAALAALVPPAGPTGAAVTSTTAPTPASTTTTTAPPPLAPRAQAALCAAHARTLKGAEPVLAFDGSNKEAPLGLLGQVRVSGVGVGQAVAAERAFLGDLARTPPAERRSLAPYLAAFGQVLSIVAGDRDSLIRANADPRMRRDDGPVVVPGGPVTALLADLVAGCPVTPTRPAPGSHRASG